MMIWDPTVTDVCNQINANFTALHPNVTITINQVPSDTYDQVLNTQMQATPPDVFMYYASNLMDNMAKGYFGDLSDTGIAARITAGYIGGCTLNGKLYAVPLNATGECVFYNKKVFSDNNLSVPKTYADFLSDCAALKAAGIAPITFGGGDTWPIGHAFGSLYGTFLSDYYFSQNSQPPQFTKDLFAGTATYANSDYVSLLGRFQDLFNNGYFIDGGMGMTQDQADQHLIDGDAGMMLLGTYQLASLVDPTNNPNPDNIRIFILPNDSGATGVVAFPDKAIGYSANGAHTDWSKELVKFYAQPDQLNIFLNATASFPCVTDVTPDALPAAALDYIAAQKTATVQTSWYNVYVPASIATDFDNIFKGIFSGDSNAITNGVVQLDKDYQLDKDTIVWPS